jgi:hypothetical protein
MQSSPRTPPSTRSRAGVCVLRAAFVSAAVAALSACSTPITRVKPGQSVRLALAAIPDVLPSAVGESPSSSVGSRFVSLTPAPGLRTRGPAPRIIYPEPELPSRNDGAPTVAEIYSAANFAMQTGQNAQAIATFEKVVEQDPNFADAWTKLVKLYERTGAREKAAGAYRKLKQLGHPNGSAAGLDSAGALGIR